MEILLCNQFEDAIIGFIIKKWKEISPANKIGRTIVQKVAYFLKAKGIPLTYDFEIHHYGPYSQELYSRIDDLVADNIIIDRSSSANKSLYEPGFLMDRLLESYHEQLEPYQNDITTVIKIFNKLPSAAAMELLATIHYLHNSYKAYYKKDPEKEMIVTRVKMIKREKFSNEEIKNAYTIMEKDGMLSWQT